MSRTLKLDFPAPETYPCEECSLKEVDIEDLKKVIINLRDMVKVAEKGLIRALPSNEPHIALEVAQALSKMQKIRNG